MLRDWLKKSLPESAVLKVRAAQQAWRSYPAYRQWHQRLSADELLDLDMLARGLAPHPTTPDRTAEERLAVAERIVNAYQAATSTAQAKDARYSASNEWVAIFSGPLESLTQALKSGNAKQVRDLLDNFYRSSASVGLCGLATDMAKEFFEDKPSKLRRNQLLVDQVYRYRFLEKQLGTVTPSDLYIPNVGNPYGIYVDGQFVRNGAEYCYYYAHRVRNELPTPSDRSVVLELGGGIGLFGYYLQSRHDGGLAYVNLDLPEILAISSYQLLNLLPGSSALLFGEADPGTTDFSTFDLVLMPSFVIEDLPDNFADVSFNSYSLAEMGPETIENYVAHLSRLSSSSIFHVNHINNSLVSADDFGFEAAGFELVSRELAGWNDARLSTHDEFEFLYRRRGA